MAINALRDEPLLRGRTNRVKIRKRFDLIQIPQPMRVAANNGITCPLEYADAEWAWRAVRQILNPRLDNREFIVNLDRRLSWR